MASAITRWNPWNELFELHSQMDALFNGELGSMAGLGVPAQRSLAAAADHLAVDIRQSDSEYTIEASIPGFRPEDVEVTFDDGVLTIAGHHRSEQDAQGVGDYVRRERRMASFHRQIVLPQEVLASDIRAAFENGVLTVVAPRARRPEPQRIPVATTVAMLDTAAKTTTTAETVAAGGD